MSARLNAVGIVAIGRNEGERLRRCLESLPEDVGAVAYVDSGSTDGSAEFAVSRGVEVVELDMSVPFSAARARNAGFQRLLEVRPDLDKVQFVDGDCVVAEGWLQRAVEALDANSDVVAVWGSRREIFPERSVYNRLCDLEWNKTPPGETRAFGGDVMVRVEGFRQVDGYDPSVIAAEDDEFSVRMRKEGWRILRIDADMTRHDAAMTSWRQWWKRAVRCGYAYAQVSAIHGAPPERYFITELRRTLIWGLAVPLLALSLAWPTGGLSLLLLLGLYLVRAVRIAWRCRRQGWTRRNAAAWGISCSLSCIPQLFGVKRYSLNRVRGLRPTIIEYKSG